MLDTANRNRVFYNAADWYERFQKEEGWNTPQELVRKLSLYLSDGERIIDVGCGSGLVGEQLRQSRWKGVLVGVDIAENRLHEARLRPAYTMCVQANVYRLPFNDGSFDIVVSNAMVGLTGTRSIREMRRLVKRDGYMVIVAGELKEYKWSRDRFQKVCSYLEKLKGVILLKCDDLGSGYAKSQYVGEHYQLFIHRCL